MDSEGVERRKKFGNRKAILEVGADVLFWEGTMGGEERAAVSKDTMGRNYLNSP